MTITNCTVEGCTRPAKGRVYCPTHQAQKRRGHTPGKAPDRYVDAATVRPLLLKLRENHSMTHLGRILGVTPRTIARAANPDVSRITRTLAESIRFASGEHFEPAAKPGPAVTGAEVIEYAQTPDGQAFIARCRTPRKYRMETAA